MATCRLWDACWNILLDGLLPVTISNFCGVKGEECETNVWGLQLMLLILHEVGEFQLVRMEVEFM